MQRQAVIFGNTHAKYHPLVPMANGIRETLLALVEVTAEENYEKLSLDELSRFALCIAYFEVEEPLAQEQVQNLLDYVRKGGALLVLHNGIAIQEPPQKAIFSARFLGHPPYDEMPVLSYTATQHTITEGITSFSMPEEAYMFEVESMEKLSPFLWYDYEDERYPAGWANEYGRGRMVYLAPGHSAEVWKSNTFARLLCNAVAWAMK